MFCVHMNLMYNLHFSAYYFQIPRHVFVLIFGGYFKQPYVIEYGFPFLLERNLLVLYLH